MAQWFACFDANLLHLLILVRLAIGKQNAKSLKALYFDGAWSAPEADVMLGWDDCVMRLRRISMQEYLAEKGSLPEAWRKMSTTHVCRLEMA